MFDNINPQTNRQNYQTGANPPPGQNNSNQPSGNPMNAIGQGTSVTDMFADTEKVEKPEIFKPKPGPAYGDGIDGFPPEMMAGSGNNHKIFTLLTVIVGMALLGTGGYFGYQYYQDNFANPAPDINIQPEDQTQTPADAEATAERSNTEQKNAVPDNPATTPAQNETENTGNIPSEDTNGLKNAAATSTVEILDTDQDGLTDSEEISLGTSQTNVDTDSDGLSDREEVKVYKTNPLNPDTDGDSFKDGDEVKSGYNPNGEGKLYEINQQ